MTKIDERRCTGCGICVSICPPGIEIADGKAGIKDERAKCLKNASDSCPWGAIVLGGEGDAGSSGGDVNINSGSGRGMGQGQRRGMGTGRGRGLGRGPMDGRGSGRGGGGRRRC